MQEHTQQTPLHNQANCVFLAFVPTHKNQWKTRKAVPQEAISTLLHVGHSHYCNDEHAPHRALPVQGRACPCSPCQNAGCAAGIVETCRKR
jgi:hypothetical protein